jgi:hypothetical protein
VIDWAMELALSLTTLEALSTRGDYYADSEESYPRCGISLRHSNHYGICKSVPFPFRIMEEADKLIEGLSHLHPQSLSLMHPVMIQDQHRLEIRLMMTLR